MMPENLDPAEYWHIGTRDFHLTWQGCVVVVLAAIFLGWTCLSPTRGGAKKGAPAHQKENGPAFRQR